MIDQDLTDPTPPVRMHAKRGGGPRTPTRPGRTYYAVYREGRSSVLASQVVEPLSRLRKAGHDVRLLIFYAVGEWIRPSTRRQWQSIRATLKRILGDTVSWWPSPPARSLGLWNEVRWYRYWFALKKPAVLHCRGTRMTRMALEARPDASTCAVIYDCRGVEHAEHEYVNAAPDRPEQAERVRQEAQVLFDMQQQAARGADAVVCVSEAMARYLSDEMGVPPAQITVIPCTVDVDRFTAAASRRDAIRADLGLEEAFVVTFCGSLHTWQCPERSLSLFKAVKQIVPAAHYLVLTTMPDKMARLAEASDVAASDMTIRSVPYKDVPGYLAASDVGLLVREDSLVNRVASPVKFGEYLASGTPVLISEGIGDYSSMTADYDLGAVIPSEDRFDDVSHTLTKFLVSYQEDPHLYQARCVDIARKHLDGLLHTKRIGRLYQSLYKAF